MLRTIACARSLACVRAAAAVTASRTPLSSQAPRSVLVPSLDALTAPSLAAALSIPEADVLATLASLGEAVEPAAALDPDVAEFVASEYGVHLALAPSARKPRAPVVAIMGHVDHGKTTLLDALRHSHLADREAGHITQRIGAFKVACATQPGASITFLDTPGHAAFTGMRSRGAHVTNIVLLVVAGDDGVMPQTVEAIEHARRSGAPMIVVVTKADLPDVAASASLSAIAQRLAQHNVLVEQMYGDVPMVPVSAVTGAGLSDLEQAILAHSEMLELTGSADGPPYGVVIEARLERGLGPVASVLMLDGSVKRGQCLVAGSEWAKVRVLRDDAGRPIKSAGPSDPVEIVGWKGVPLPGTAVALASSESAARRLAAMHAARAAASAAASTAAAVAPDPAGAATGAAHRARAARRHGARGAAAVAADAAAANEAAEAEAAAAAAAAEASGPTKVPVVLKTDMPGTGEAIVHAVRGLPLQQEVQVQLVSQGIGSVTEHDIDVAASASADVFAFGVRPASAKVTSAARQAKVVIHTHTVIYSLLDDVRQLLGSRLQPRQDERVVGVAEVLQVFPIHGKRRGHAYNVAGCKITRGQLHRDAQFRVLRDSDPVHSGTAVSLRHFKQEVAQLQKGNECGLHLSRFDDVQPGDVIECYRVIRVPRTLDDPPLVPVSSS